MGGNLGYLPETLLEGFDYFNTFIQSTNCSDPGHSCFCPKATIIPTVQEDDFKENVFVPELLALPKQTQKDSYKKGIKSDGYYVVCEWMMANMKRVKKEQQDAKVQKVPHAVRRPRNGVFLQGAV